MSLGGLQCPFGVLPLPLRRGRVARPLPSLPRESSASRSIFILEAESRSKTLRRVSTRDPPGGVSRLIFFSASSIAAAVASAAHLPASSFGAGGVSLTLLLQPGLLGLHGPELRLSLGLLLDDSSSNGLDGFPLGLAPMPSALPPSWRWPPGRRGLCEQLPDPAASASRLSWAAAVSRTAAAVSAAEMATTAEVWIAMRCSIRTLSSCMIRTASSTALFCCAARCLATCTLRGTLQIRSHARGTSRRRFLATRLLLLAEGPDRDRLPLWADSTSLLWPARFSCSRGWGLALDLQATARKAPRAASPWWCPPLPGFSPADLFVEVRAEVADYRL